MKTKVKNIGSNMTELVIKAKENHDSSFTGKGRDYLYLLFSYETPVAGWDKNGPFKTEKKFSAITTRHINKYFDRPSPESWSHSDPRVVTQEWITEQLAIASN